MTSLTQSHSSVWAQNEQRDTGTRGSKVPQEACGLQMWSPRLPGTPAAVSASLTSSSLPAKLLFILESPSQTPFSRRRPAH